MATFIGLIMNSKCQQTLVFVGFALRKWTLPFRFDHAIEIAFLQRQCVIKLKKNDIFLL